MKNYIAKILLIMRINRLHRAALFESPERLLRLFVILTIISGTVAILLQFAAVHLFNRGSTVYREHLSIELGSHLQISISTANTPIEVYTHNSDTILIEYTGENPLWIDETPEFLRIGTADGFKFSLFSLGQLSYCMKIYLPQITYAELRLSAVSGDIYAENITADFINISTRSGGIKLHEPDGIVSINSRTGDIALTFGRFDEPCAVESDTGDIAVLMPPENDLRLNYFTDTGRFTSDIFRPELNGWQGDLYLTKGANQTRFTARTISGNLSFLERVVYVR
ncbi:MAG: DUF4097 domain-containing protein [Oscillospiraceae bacterium]|nr:DUF4097 domain-containing protein [Oscillospiraceae bacterium]